MKICNYCFESNSLIYFCIVLNKNWNLLVWAKFYCSWVGGPCSLWGLLLIPFGFITPKHVLNYLTFQSLDFERIRWRLFQAYQMKVIPSISDEGYSERIRWRLFWAYQMKVIPSVSDEGYSERIRWRLFWAYQMKVILSVSDEGYSERIRWRLFQKRVMGTLLDIYGCITGFQK
jgi:hypothetical protein